MNAPGRRAGTGPLAGLAALLGLEPAPFDGPLLAFAAGGDHRAGGPIYLAGDLHARHRSAPDRDGRRDPSLDAATIALIDPEHGPLHTAATEGIWWLPLPADGAPHFLLWDSEGRLRTWLHLPPPHLLIGQGRHWLPAVPPASDSPGASGRRPDPGPAS